ncbi:hypothetical protein ACKWTF_003353 [Chironomus riparius]
MKLFFLIILVSAALISKCNGGVKALNETIDAEKLSREKRYLVFPPTTSESVLKLVTSYLGPIDTPLSQQVNCFRNFQYQYGLPSHWYSNFPVFPNLFKRRSESGRAFDGDSNEVQLKPDSSRKIAYEIVEEMLNKEHKNGRECVLHTICQVAETPLSHNGFIGELLQIFFTPGEHEIIDDDYRYAMKAGLHHVDCDKIYPDCPLEHRILDSFSIIENFHLDEFLNF